MKTCPRCNFQGASDKSFVHAAYGLQCPRCRGLIRSGDMVAAATTPTGEPYVSTSFLSVITPDDVGTEKRDIEPYAEETDLKAQMAKSSIPGALMTAWNDFFVSWKNFYSSSTGFIEAGAKYKQALSYRAQLHALQGQLDPYLTEKTTPVPLPIEAPAGNATAPKPPSTGSSILDGLQRASDKWSTVAVVGLVVGGGLLAALIYYQAKNSLAITDKYLPKLIPGLG